MDKFKPNANVMHPGELLASEGRHVSKFNNRLALKITNSVGSMWSAYLFALLSLTSLPAILVLLSPHMRSVFPKFIVDTSVITLIAWISQNFLQLVLLPVIMVGQNVIQDRQSAKAETDHRTLTYLANLQEEQMIILEELKKSLK
jgi:hypothetical protein